jgi:ribosomal protein S12 methylthiotransferase accessory factor
MLERKGLTNVIHPNAVMAFSEAQYCQRDAINALNINFHFVPEPLPDDLPVSWSPIWSMSQTCVKYLPTQLVRYQAKDSQAVYAKGCSNGSAAGNTLEEAILQGFCELVERDATAIWWYNRLRRPGIDLSTYDDDAYFCQLRKEYQARNREIWALDLTSDLGIPVVAAISKHIRQTSESILIGLGCHLNMRIAVDRALAELNQMFWMSFPDHDTGLSGLNDKSTLHWFATATTENQSYLLPATQLPPTCIDAIRPRSSGHLLADIDLCRNTIEAKGMEMLVLDQTRDDIGLPVVKVVVPGLRHFWRRLGPGRLYDVPVQMGWLNTAHTEDALNPIPIFF